MCSSSLFCCLIPALFSLVFLIMFQFEPIRFHCSQRLSGSTSTTFAEPTAQLMSQAKTRRSASGTPARHFHRVSDVHLLRRLLHSHEPGNVCLTVSPSQLFVAQKLGVAQIAGFFCFSRLFRLVILKMSISICLLLPSISEIVHTRGQMGHSRSSIAPTFTAVADLLRRPLLLMWSPCAVSLISHVGKPNDFWATTS